MSNSKLNVVENPIIKIYLHLLFLHLRASEEEREKIGLNEGFFLGTFEELKKEYHEYDYDYEYKDTESIKNIIKKMKKNSQRYLKGFLIEIFQEIIDFWKLYGNQDDIIINKMINESNDISYNIFGKFSDD